MKNESDLDRAIKEFGVDKIDSIRKHKLGDRLVLPNGWIFQYAKIDFGISGKTNKGKTLRNIQYKWIAVPL